MSDRLLNLPVPLMAVVVVAGTYLVAAGIYFVVTRLAVNDRARAFKALSPGMLPPLGIIFGLLVGFIAAQVWSDFEKARAAVATKPVRFARSCCSRQSFPASLKHAFVPS